MAILLPSTPAPRAARPRLLDWGADQVPVLGGPMQRIGRIGSRHAIDYDMPPMLFADAMSWAQRLKRGKFERVLMEVPQPDLVIGNPGLTAIHASVSGGSVIGVRGLTSAYPIKEGQFFSVIHGGRRYVHSFNAAATAPVIPNHSIIAVANTTVTHLGGSIYRIEKTGGVHGTADASAKSTAVVSLNRDVAAMIKPLGPSAVARRVAGLNSDPDTDSGFTGIDRAITFKDNGTFAAMENGTEVSTPAAYTLGEHFFVRRRLGSVVEYLRGPSADMDAATVFHTGAASTATLYFDCSIIASDGAIDAKFFESGVSLTGLSITPMLRTPLTAGDTVELAVPLIEGVLEGDQVEAPIDEMRMVGFSFTVTEAA